MYAITAQHKNIATSVEGAFLVMNNNCSLPPGNDCCHQIGTTTSGDVVVQTLKNKFEFPIPNRLISRQYLR